MESTFLELVKNCENDVTLDNSGHKYDLTFCDFEGFDSEWEEIFRSYDNPKEVNRLMQWLTDWCEHSETDGLYNTYYFSGFSVTVGFESFDI